MRPTSLLAATALFPLVSCSTTGDSGQLTLVTGGESTADVFSAAPAPATLRVDSVTPTGTCASLTTTKLAEVLLPATTIDLGSQPETTETVLTVTGLAGGDAGDARVLFGASLPMYLGNLNGYNLNIFVQRTGEFARVSTTGMSDARTAPTLAVAEGANVFVGGGNEGDLSTQVFDLLSYSWLTSPPTMPVVPRSVVFDGLVAWLFDTSAAAYYDFSGATTSTAITLPSGGASGDVAGGATISDGSLSSDCTPSRVYYVVGATRSSAASNLVLKVDTSSTSQSGYAYGYPTWLTGSTPRLGAAALWVAGYGLVLVGGNTTTDGAGVEVFAAGATIGAPHAFPADATTGAGADALDANHVILAGGLQADGSSDAGVRVLDLSCSQGCAPTTCLSSLPSTLVTAQVFDIDGSNATAVGDGLDGTTHVFHIASADAWTTCTATEIATKVPHTRARAVVSPASTIVPGSFLLVGGAAGGELEGFVP